MVHLRKRRREDREDCDRRKSSRERPATHIAKGALSRLFSGFRAASQTCCRPGRPRRYRAVFAGRRSCSTDNRSMLGFDLHHRGVRPGYAASMGGSDRGDSRGAGELKAPRPGEETAAVMITVKTYPNPSDKYLETVCVAGVRLDRGRPEWIRLYPVKFRNEDLDKQFKKYEILRLNGTYNQTNDNRPESFRPRQEEMVHVEHVNTKNNWLRDDN